MGLAFVAVGRYRGAAPVVNALVPELRRVHYRLTWWGQALRAYTALPRAWPRNTLLGRVAEGGPDWAVMSGSTRTGEMAGLERRVHRVVKELLPQNQQLAICEYYLTTAPVEVMAPNLRVSAKSFYGLLNDARRSVREELMALGDRGC